MHISVSCDSAAVYQPQCASRAGRQRQLCGNVAQASPFYWSPPTALSGGSLYSNTYCPEDVMGALYNTILTAKKSFPDACLVTNSIIARRDVSPGILYQTNQNIRWLCKELGVIYLNVGNYLDNSCLAKDGIHLNRKGTFILSKVIAKTASLCEKVNLRPTKFLNQIEVNCMDKCTIPHLQKKRKAVDQQPKVPQRTSITVEPSTPSTSYRHSTSHPESHTAPSPPLQPFPNPPVSAGSLLDMNAYPPLPAVSFVSSGDSDGMNVSKSTNFASQPDFALNWSRAKSPITRLPRLHDRSLDCHGSDRSLDCHGFMIDH
ncbi:hypothetical protein J6590_087332 [Homalodisca vitripennis]|nr:hypothetical protein J6590_087332 [Homalodisca vitripennis]